MPLLSLSKKISFPTKQGTTICTEETLYMLVTLVYHFLSMFRVSFQSPKKHVRFVRRGGGGGSWTSPTLLLLRAVTSKKRGQPGTPRICSPEEEEETDLLQPDCSCWPFLWDIIYIELVSEPSRLHNTWAGPRTVAISTPLPKSCWHSDLLVYFYPTTQSGTQSSLPQQIN